MKLSKYGRLREMLDKSGIMGNPIILTAELCDLANITKELSNSMKDIECRPLASYFERELEEIERILQARVAK